jgi:predicted CXXCH cytochrome family protein
MWINERIRRTLAAGLVVALAGVVAAGCGDDDPAPPTTGAIGVTTVTTGDNPDADGYAVTLDGNVAGNIGVNEVLIIPDLAVATYSVGLTNIAANCTVAGDNPRDVPVTAGLTANTQFDVDCPGAPAGVTLTAETAADEVTLTWDESALATSYRAELVGGTADLVKADLAAGTTVAVFTNLDDGLEDGVTYAATVYAINDEGEAASNEEDVTTNFFPWDENFPTSLHEGGWGKTTFYNAVPNRGFEEYTGVAYSELACIGCHSQASGLPPVSGRGCDRCHDTADPQLGDEVDTNWTDGVCIGCHSRQKLERDLGYTDVHRTMGFECDDCHGNEDLHGDGNQYDGLMDIGAIKAQCENCHDATEHPANQHHPDTDGRIACASCHAQTAVTCNNCHFEAQVPPITGKFFLKPPAHNWLWLGNRLKRDGSGETEVYPVNYQSVAYENDTFVAFGFYTPHTIGTGRSCSDCHNNQGGTNEAIDEYNATGEIYVAEWDEGAGNLIYPTGIVPMPNDYLTSLKFDFATTDDPAGAPGTWTFLKAGADTIQVLEFWMTPLDTDQMAALGMVAPAP